jgi:peroxiredoxin
VECKPFHIALCNTALTLPELAEAYLSQEHLISVFPVLEFSVIYSAVRKYWQRLSSKNFRILMTISYS